MSPIRFKHMAKQHSVTMKELAARAGVSVAAVSAALGGKYKTIGVSSETRARIIDLAQREGYRINANARALRRNLSDVIGYFGEFETWDLFHAELLRGLRNGCEAEQKNFLVYGEFRERTPDEIIAQFTNGSIDGLVYYRPGNTILTERLAAVDLPVVAIVDPCAGLASVVADDAGGIRILMEYLVERGHRRFVFCRQHQEQISGARRRIAFEEFLRKSGLQGYVWAFDDRDPAQIPRVDLLPLSERPTAIVCWHDVTAYRVHAHYSLLGIQIPRDVALCGFDGDPTPTGITWRLTSVQVSWAYVASRAVSLLLETDAIPAESVVPVSFIRGDTA